MDTETKSLFLKHTLPHFITSVVLIGTIIYQSNKHAEQIDQKDTVIETQQETIKRYIVLVDAKDSTMTSYKKLVAAQDSTITVLVETNKTYKMMAENTLVYLRDLLAKRTTNNNSLNQ